MVLHIRFKGYEVSQLVSRIETTDVSEELAASLS
jgi:hypothetical protein